MFTSDRAQDGRVRRAGLDARRWPGPSAVVIAVLNVWLLCQTFAGLDLPENRAMYRRILVAIENSAADRTILDARRAQLAQLTGAQLLLVHVADGWVARHFDELQAARVRGDEGRPRVSRTAARPI